MTSIAPPPPPPPPSGLPSAPQLTVSLGAAGKIFSGLPIDTLFTTTVTSETGKQPITLQTPNGPLSFKAPFNLPNAAQVTFKLIALVPNPQIQLTHIQSTQIPTQTPAQRVFPLASQILGLSSSVGGLNTPNTPAQAQTGQAQAIGSAPTPGTILSMNNTAGGLRGVVLSLNSPTMPGANTSSQPGAPTQQTAITAPQSQTPAGTGLANLQSGGAPSAPSVQMPILNGPAHPIQPGSQLTLRLVSVTLPGETPTSPSSQSSASTPAAGTNTAISARVVSTLPNGQPVLQLPQGRITLETQAKFPEGTTVRLEILSAQKPLTQSGLQGMGEVRSNPMSELARNWPALQEAMDTLKASNPALADSFTKTTLPRPDSTLSANLLFFLKALGRGNLKNWADDQTLRALTRAKPGLARQLEDDFQTLSKKATSQNANDWKIAHIPMNDAGQIQQIRIAQRDHKDEEQSGKEDPGVRFVIDLDLSAFGPMQLDALAKDRHKKCDLIIRTKTALPGHVRKDIHDIYENALETLRFEGKLSFQVTPNFIEVDGLELAPGQLNLGMLV